jgi:two-component system OmpR family sensor kinase
MLAVWWVVTRSTRPLARAREQVARRAADELSPLVAPGLPDEVRPLVDEINLLFGRLAEAFAAQQSFVADAAHELRSPLAALRLQVQSMQRATDTDARAVAARRLLAGIDRSARLVDQMLVLAREDAAAGPTTIAPVDLRETIALAINDVLPLAQERRIDLGISEAETLSVNGDLEALRILFRNLLENGIKYAPQDGTVDVAIRSAHGAPVVEVADSGPGIPMGDRDHAFDRFYRVAGSAATPGSGLGLAIAQSIARRHHATLTLDTSSRLGGLLVTVRFHATNSFVKHSVH